MMPNEKSSASPCEKDLNFNDVLKVEPEINNNTSKLKIPFVRLKRCRVLDSHCSAFQNVTVLLTPRKSNFIDEPEIELRSSHMRVGDVQLKGFPSQGSVSAKSTAHLTNNEGVKRNPVVIINRIQSLDRLALEYRPGVSTSLNSDRKGLDCTQTNSLPHDRLPNQNSPDSKLVGTSTEKWDGIAKLNPIVRLKRITSIDIQAVAYRSELPMSLNQAHKTHGKRSKQIPVVRTNKVTSPDVPSVHRYPDSMRCIDSGELSNRVYPVVILTRDLNIDKLSDHLYGSPDMRVKIIPNKESASIPLNATRAQLVPTIPSNLQLNHGESTKIITSHISVVLPSRTPNFSTSKVTRPYSEAPKEVHNAKKSRKNDSTKMSQIMNSLTPKTARREMDETQNENEMLALKIKGCDSSTRTTGCVKYVNYSLQGSSPFQDLTNSRLSSEALPLEPTRLVADGEKTTCSYLPKKQIGHSTVIQKSCSSYIQGYSVLPKGTALSVSSNDRSSPSSSLDSSTMKRISNHSLKLKNSVSDKCKRVKHSSRNHSSSQVNSYKNPELPLSATSGSGSMKNCGFNTTLETRRISRSFVNSTKTEKLMGKSDSDHQLPCTRSRAISRNVTRSNGLQRSSEESAAHLEASSQLFDSSSTSQNIHQPPSCQYKNAQSDRLQEAMRRLWDRFADCEPETLGNRKPSSSSSDAPSSDFKAIPTKLKPVRCRSFRIISSRCAKSYRLRSTRKIGAAGPQRRKSLIPKSLKKPSTKTQCPSWAKWPKDKMSRFMKVQHRHITEIQEYFPTIEECSLNQAVLEALS